MNMKFPSLMHPVHESLRALGVEILDTRHDLVRCPGEHLHTSPSNPRDCKLLGTPCNPVLKCFHSSCADEVARINMLLSGRTLMRTSGNAAGTTPSAVSVPTPVVDQTRINEVLAQHPWDYQAIESACPNEVSAITIESHARALLLLFDDDDVIWFGRDVHDTGSQGHQWRFRTKSDWWNTPGNWGHFTCPSTFNPRSFSRSAANVKDRRYLVVESDILSRDQVGSIFQWMIAKGHRLRAVVDTAGKSLHGWFEFPGEATLPGLKSELVQLGCDPAMCGASQPCRLPGAERNGKWQKLIYLDA